MIYSIGHSTLSKPDFLAVASDLDTIIDVRSHPGSTKYPHFNSDQMAKWLKRAKIRYELDLRLGGWGERHIELASSFVEFDVDVAIYAKRKFPKQRIALARELGSKPSWTNQGLFDYSFFQTLPEFLVAADDVIARSVHEDVGLLCSESLWWKCHRSMIADYLFTRQVEVVHLQPKRVEHSRVISNRIERYHPYVLAAWKAYARLTHTSTIL